jgi:hypothetical protein
MKSPRLIMRVPLKDHGPEQLLTDVDSIVGEANAACEKCEAEGREGGAPGCDWCAYRRFVRGQLMASLCRNQALEAWIRERKDESTTTPSDRAVFYEVLAKINELKGVTL